MNTFDIQILLLSGKMAYYKVVGICINKSGAVSMLVGNHSEALRVETETIHSIFINGDSVDKNTLIPTGDSDK